MKQEKLKSNFDLDLIEREFDGKLVVRIREKGKDAVHRVCIVRADETSLIRTAKVDPWAMSFFQYFYQREPNARSRGNWYWNRLACGTTIVKDFRDLGWNGNTNYEGSMLCPPEWANGVYIHLPNRREQQIPEVIPYEFVRYRRLR